MSPESDELNQTVEDVCHALRAHADVVRTSASNPTAIVNSGERVSRAVLKHEAALMRVAGWSSPLRHVGRLPFYETSIGKAPGDPDGGTAVVVTARYELDVREPMNVVDMARGRFADDTIDSVSVALQRFVQAEGWDPTHVAGAAIRVAAADVDVRVDLGFGQ
jgi:hypothetical protein